MPIFKTVAQNMSPNSHVSNVQVAVLLTGMRLAGLCARFAPTIKWHRIALWGPTLASMFYKIIKWMSFKPRLMYYIYYDRITRLCMYLFNIHS